MSYTQISQLDIVDYLDPRMKNRPFSQEKSDILGIKVSATDYNSCVTEIKLEAKKRNSITVTALAVHGLMTGFLNRDFKDILNKIDIVVPDGQPIQWALNILHKNHLKSTVRGTNLTLKVCKMAEKENIGVYLFGSTKSTVNKMAENLGTMFRGLKISGVQPDRFRKSTEIEDMQDIKTINESCAGIVLVGTGCPRQEKWIYSHKGKIDAVMIAVGAAFDFIAGSKPEAPLWIQGIGMEWLYRFIKEPRRMWKRYVLLNPMYMSLILFQFIYLKFYVKSKELLNSVK